MSTKAKIENFSDYFEQFPEAIQEILETIRNTIREAAPAATEKISYQMPTFYLHGNLVHFAAYKNHIGFYPTPSAIEAFAAELAPYERSKGAVQLPLDQPLPLALISQMVKFRVEENVKKAAAKSKKKSA